MRTTWILVLGICCACTGIIDDPSGREGAGGATGSRGSADGSGAESAGLAARTPTVRLTAREYDNTLRTVFGAGFPAASGLERLAVDAAVGRYDRNAVAVDVRTVETLQQLAEENAAAFADRVDSLVTCDAPETRDCAEATLATYGRRLFRRPLQTGELAVFTSLFDLGAADEGHAGGYRLAVEALLQAPQFLYRIEPGLEPDADGTYELGDHAIASRLSFFLWDGGPDDELLDAADRGELRTLEQIATQARRMIADERFRASLRDFHRQWLDLRGFDSVEKDPEVHPEFDAELKSSMLAATMAFVEHVYLEDDATLETLLTASYAFADARLAGFYGVDPPAEGLARVELDRERRAGLFTEPSVLSLYANGAGSDPIVRGLLIREWLMCMPPPPPPPDVVDDIASLQIDYEKPVRQRYEATMREGTSCVGCHRSFNPIGFGLEHYDATGAYRLEDALVADEYDATVDATADLSFVPGLEGVVVYGAPGMMERFVDFEPVQRCIAEQWYEYALDRTPGRGDDEAIDGIVEGFATSGFDLRELLVAIATSEAFRTNRLPAREEP